MKKVKFLLVVLLCIAASLVAMTASASIGVSEDFDGASIFVDQNWSGQTANDRKTTPTSARLEIQGLNVRSWDTAAVNTAPKWAVTNSGTVTSSRAFRGHKGATTGKALQLASGQGVVCTAFPDAAHMAQKTVYQFAVSSTPETGALAAGTQIGHFKLDYTCDGTTAWNSATNTVRTANRNVAINFVVNANNNIDIISSLDSVKVGELKSPGPGSWSVITVVMEYVCTWTSQSTSDSNSEKWCGPVVNDSGQYTGLYKGPAALNANPNIDIVAHWQTIPTGFNVFVDGNVQKTRVGRLLLGPDPASSAHPFGTQVGATDAWVTGHGGVGTATYPISWEIKAENGGTLIIDDLFATAFGFGGATNVAPGSQHTQEQALRINFFDQKSTVEPPVAASGPNWMLY